MKRACVILLLFFITTACSVVDNVLPEEGALEEQLNKKVLIIDELLSVEDTLSLYFSTLYQSYLDLEYTDISSLFNMELLSSKNTLAYYQNLILRRQVIDELKLFFVEKEEKPYSINIESMPDDERMDVFSSHNVIGGYDELVHFTIRGDNSHAYPPFMSLNSQHTMALKKIDGVLKVVFHYFVGSSRLRGSEELKVLSIDEMKEEVLSVIKEPQIYSNLEIPDIAHSYKSEQAKEYAIKHLDNPNSIFYKVDDWMGNCANYTSQAVWYGFVDKENGYNSVRDYMTRQWYAGAGGGLPSWENVEVFWQYVTIKKSSKQEGIHGYIIDSVKDVDIGDIVQIRSNKLRGTNEKFSHNLLVIDKEKLVLAQNSPNSLVCYADLEGVDFRFFRPVYLIK